MKIFKKSLIIALFVIASLTGCKDSEMSEQLQTQNTISQFVENNEPEFEQPKNITKPLEVIAKQGAPKTEENQISIGSFNIRQFGNTKIDKKNVTEKLVEIVDDYDIIAIQEFLDKDKKVPYKFLDMLNENDKDYGIVMSKKGQGYSKNELYVFYFDKDKITYLNKSYLYPDEQKEFSRPPFMAYFKVKNGNFDFVLGTVHTKPDNAKKEISALAKVFDHASAKYNEKDVIIVGDYNADGTYYDEDNTNQILEDTERYYFAIPDKFDTTVAKSSNTYDRIVFLRGTKEDFTRKAGVDYFFMRWPEITNEEEGKISDHYPVYAIFNTNKDND